MKTYNLLRSSVLDIALKMSGKEYVNRKTNLDDPLSDGLFNRILQGDQLQKIANFAQGIWERESDLPPKITRGFPIDEEFVLDRIFPDVPCHLIEDALKNRASIAEVA